ncbi:MAG: cyclic 2,3-diphosphoglycerate synthase [Thermoplasmata archaeon]
MVSKKKVIIMGAAGRDFHNFNMYFRGNSYYDVVAFTATQIPNITGRKYPAQLAGALYPNGIPIYPESDLPNLIKKHDVDQVVFAYSDISHETLMHKASLVLASGADFRLMGPKSTMIKSTKPVISICAIRTGAGKSQTTRRICDILRHSGKKVAAIRHPMPYGDLVKQEVQRFATLADLDKHDCTIEEREEYEPHITMGVVVYAGVDYEKILRAAEKEADVILWDGGNNDISFYKSEVNIVVTDPHRPGHEISYYPGEVNLRMADIIIINKVDTAHPEDIETVRRNARETNPNAKIIEAASPLVVDKPELVRNKKVLVIEDGPTLTHGGMKYGAGTIAAEKLGASEIVDPHSYAVGSIKDTFKQYPMVGKLLPAMGYGPQQVRDLEKTINAVKCDVVVSGTPIDLTRVLKPNKEIVRVSYELQEIGRPNLEDMLKEFKII